MKCNFLDGAECPLAPTCAWAAERVTQQGKRAICEWGLHHGGNHVGCTQCRQRSGRKCAWSCWKLERHRRRAAAARAGREPA